MQSRNVLTGLQITTFGLCVAALTSCIVSRPEGPGERIGRGIDEITRALDDIPSTRVTPTPTPRPRWDRGLWEDRPRSYDEPDQVRDTDRDDSRDSPYY